MSMAHDVFISYSSRDKTVADAACAALENRKVRCWMAPRDILPGSGYGESIVDAIEGSRVLVLILSSSANTSPQVMREVERAVSKGLAVLPLRIEDVSLSKEMEYFLSSRHWLDALSPPLERHLATLVESVRALLDAKSGVTRGGEAAELHRATLGSISASEALAFELKHYVYISDKKVDMLLAQVPKALRQRLAAQLGAEPADLAPPLKDSERNEESRIVRVRAAALVVRGSGKVGAPDAPSDYVAGTMTMKWGPYGLGSQFIPPIAYFCGATDQTVVGLGGSAKHLVGWNDPYGGIDFGSAQPDLLTHLATEAEIVEGETMPTGKPAEAKDWMKIVFDTPRCVTGPEQRLEFLAKKLLHGDFEDEDSNPNRKKVLLGSPLYVALAD